MVVGGIHRNHQRGGVRRKERKGKIAGQARAVPAASLIVHD